MLIFWHFETHAELITVSGTRSFFQLLTLKNWQHDIVRAKKKLSYFYSRKGERKKVGTKPKKKVCLPLAPARQTPEVVVRIVRQAFLNQKRIWWRNHWVLLWNFRKARNLHSKNFKSIFILHFVSWARKKRVDWKKAIQTIIIRLDLSFLYLEHSFL